MSEENISEIASFSKSVCTGLDPANVEVKQKLIELLELRGKLAIENEEKVVYISCKLQKKPLLRSLVQTSLLRSTYQRNPITLTAKLVLGGVRERI